MCAVSVDGKGLSMQGKTFRDIQLYSIAMPQGRLAISSDLSGNMITIVTGTPSFASPMLNI